MKKDAKKDAKAACNGAYTLEGPQYSSSKVLGALEFVRVENLDEIEVEYSSQQVSEDQLTYFFGLDCDATILSDAECVSTILTFWGIFRGGETEQEIRDNHNLDVINFQKLVNREYVGGEITIEDDETILWDLPS